jgi:hypothetical protein
MAGRYFPQEPWMITDYIPTEDEVWYRALQKAVDVLVVKLNDSEKDAIKATDEAELIKFHRSLGTLIRNQFGLWKGENKELLQFCGEELQPDDVSMVIIHALWERLTGH